MINKNLFAGDDKLMSVPIAPEGIVDKLDTIEGWNRFVWRPNKGKEKSTPIINVYPKVGYQFAGFKIEKERKETNESLQPVKYSKLGKSSGTFTSFQYHMNTEETTDWSRDLFKYTAILNKNVYNVVIKPEFRNALGDKLERVEHIDNISVSVSSAATVTDFKFNYIESDGSFHTGISKDNLIKGNFGKNQHNELVTITSSDYNSLGGGYKNKEGQILNLQRLIPNLPLVFGESFKVQATSSKSSMKYIFKGWFIDTTAMKENPEDLNKPKEPNQFQTSRKYEYTQIIDEDFINKFKLEAHGNDDIIITAVFQLDPSNVMLSVPEEGVERWEVMAPGEQPKHEAVNPGM